MQYLGYGILLIILLLMIAARKEEVPEECHPSKATAPFFRIAALLEKKIRNGPEGWKQRFFGKNEEKLRLLEPAGDIRKSSRIQFVGKVGLTLLFLTVGMTFALIIGKQEEEESVFNPDGTLPRREYGEGNYHVELDAHTGEESRSVELIVEQRAYTEEELKTLLPAYHEALERAVLAENTDADHVNRDIDPVEELPPYPFLIEWEISDRNVLGGNGKIRDGADEAGSLVTLTAHSTYGDFEELYSFSLRVYPKSEDGDPLERRLNEALLEAAEKSRSEKSLTLPGEVDGITVIWEERKANNMALLILLVLAAAGAILWGRDKDLDKKVRERDLQLSMDYPDVVSRLSLYIGAGMSTRSAWKKMTEEYEKKGKKRFVFEEMLLARREMESGVSELTAYQHFAKRCRLQKYVKFVSLLEQNTKLGAAGFLGSLRAECREALQERRTTARRLGEEAGTKLLLPMIMMLAIVMVVIIVPAFVSI